MTSYSTMYPDKLFAESTLIKLREVSATFHLGKHSKHDRRGPQMKTMMVFPVQTRVLEEILS